MFPNLSADVCTNHTHTIENTPYQLKKAAVYNKHTIHFQPIVLAVHYSRSLPSALTLCVCACVSCPRLTGNEPLSILPLSSQPEERVAKAHYKLCDRLKLEKKQRRMCRRDPGVAETLMEAISLSALECQYQFRYERWNCTLEGRYRANILKRGACASYAAVSFSCQHHKCFSELEHS